MYWLSTGRAVSSRIPKNFQKHSRKRESHLCVSSGSRKYKFIFAQASDLRLGWVSILRMQHTLVLKQHNSAKIKVKNPARCLEYLLSVKDFSVFRSQVMSHSQRDSAKPSEYIPLPPASPPIVSMVPVFLFQLRTHRTVCARPQTWTTLGPNNRSACGPASPWLRTRTKTATRMSRLWFHPSSVRFPIRDPSIYPSSSIYCIWWSVTHQNTPKFITRSAVWGLFLRICLHPYQHSSSSTDLDAFRQPADSVSHNLCQ